MELFLDILADATKDTLVIVPFLFVTYLVLEALEHASADRVASVVRKAGPLGPVVGAVLGVLPQCGFSAMGATLFGGRVVTLGTLLAVFLSTSDEMLPLLVAERLDLALVGQILATKAAIGVVVGLAADAVVRVAAGHGRSARASDSSDGAHPGGSRSLVEGLSEAGAGTGHIHELCEHDHCHCDDEGTPAAGHPHGHEHAHDHAHGHGHDHARGSSAVSSVVRGAVSHTVQVTIFIFLITLALAAVLDTMGEQVIASTLSRNAVASVFLSAVVGLIPNCAASIVITQLYLEGALGLGAMLSGTLVAAGAGFLVLFRTNRDVRENVCVLAILVVVGITAGLVTLALGL